jgi:hypothetical protein
MRKLLLSLMFLFAAAAALPAAAQFLAHRLLPANGELGTLGASQNFPAVTIGKNVLLLTPGARIYDRNNSTIVHGQLPAGAPVVFSRDQAGYVQRIYILTEQELFVLKQSGKR